MTKYFYNDGGNINYKVNADGSKTHYVYDAEWKDLLVGFDGQTITYDEIGNPIVYRDGMNFSWTGRQLDTVTINGSTNISYAYDVNGIRTQKVVNGVATEYFINGTTIIAQKTGDDVIWYIYDSDGQVLGFTYNDTPYYYIKNLQGDVVRVVNAEGATVATYSYDPWGKLLTATGTMAEINPIRYRGYYYDSETGLYYLNSRYYDPDTCRFINADVYITTGQGLTSFNMFAYCLNNPINYVDPSGTVAIQITPENLRKVVVEGMAEYSQATMNKNNKSTTKLINSSIGAEDIIITNDTSKNYSYYTENEIFSDFVIVLDRRINVGNPQNPNITIINSYKIDWDEQQYEILREIKDYVNDNPVVYPTKNVWDRTIDSMKIEWDVHNVCYNFPRLFDRSSTQHVDLDFKDEDRYNWTLF